MSYVLSQLPSQQAFHRQADPVRAYVSALQSFLRVSATGTWDFATHDALRTYLKEVRSSNEIGEWGLDPGKVTHNALQLATPTAEAEFQRVRTLLGLLGLPNSSLETFEQYRRTNSMALLTAADKVVDAIREAESRPRPGPGPVITATGRRIIERREGPQPRPKADLPPLQRADIGLIALGVTGIILVLALVAWAWR